MMKHAAAAEKCFVCCLVLVLEVVLCNVCVQGSEVVDGLKTKWRKNLAAYLMLLLVFILCPNGTVGLETD